MKTTLFLLCLACATVALGQSAGLSNQAQPLQMASHDSRALQHAMAPEQNLLETSTYAYAQGERPLWEVAPVTVAIPLGDVARVVRQEHAKAKKATIVWNN